MSQSSSTLCKCFNTSFYDTIMQENDNSFSYFYIQNGIGKNAQTF